ncbi:MAG: DNA ligase-associated DEXH box helicase, partial [Alphaproteobacteria bacterium]
LTASLTLRQIIKPKNITLQLVISEHDDWKELIQTIIEVSPENVFVTHGREEALLSFLKKKGYNCGSLNLLGYEDEDD